MTSWRSLDAFGDQPLEQLGREREEEMRIVADDSYKCTSASEPVVGQPVCVVQVRRVARPLDRTMADLSADD